MIAVNVGVFLAFVVLFLLFGGHLKPLFEFLIRVLDKEIARIEKRKKDREQGK